MTKDKIIIELTSKELGVIKEALSAGVYYFDTISDYTIDLDKKDIEFVSQQTSEIYHNMVNAIIRRDDTTI